MSLPFGIPGLGMVHDTATSILSMDKDAHSTNAISTEQVTVQPESEKAQPLTGAENDATTSAPVHQVSDQVEGTMDETIDDNIPVQSTDIKDVQNTTPSPTAKPTKAPEPTDHTHQPASGEYREEPSPLDALEALLGQAESMHTVNDIEMQDARSNNQPTAKDTTATTSLEASTSAVVVPAGPSIELPVQSSDVPQAITSTIPESAMLDMNTDIPPTEDAEFEADSSPYESSSDDSTDSEDSSDENSESGDAYQLLSAEEQARILMEAGSDDEGAGAGKGKGGGQLRTKNEIVEEVIPKPDVTITPEMKIEELGGVQSIVENMILISGKTSGEYRVLETGSVLCLEDRSVIGAISETLGRVQQPLYCVRFTNVEEIKKAGISVGTQVYYTEKHSTYVFTQALKGLKGSDASNLFDEEIEAEEIEFSDDEAEAEHKRKLKRQKAERRGGKVREDGGGTASRGHHPLSQEQTVRDDSKGLNYDDESDEGPYKPLRRPGLDQNGVNPAASSPDMPLHAHSTAHQGRGRGRGDRGRGDRGRGDRGRGDRGRGGRGGIQPSPAPQQAWQPQPIPGSYVPGQQFPQFPPPPPQFQQGYPQQPFPFQAQQPFVPPPPPQFQQWPQVPPSPYAGAPSQQVWPQQVPHQQQQQQPGGGFSPQVPGYPTQGQGGYQQWNAPVPPHPSDPGVQALLRNLQQQQGQPRQ